MTLKLSNELKQALAHLPAEQTLRVENEDTQMQYVLVPACVFEQMQRALAYDASELKPTDFAPMMHEVLKDDWEAPGMEVYNDYHPPDYVPPKDVS